MPALAICAVLLSAGVALARDPGLILIYPGYGRPDAFRLDGRVIEDEGFREPNPGTNRLLNAINTLHRLKSEEIEHALVELSVAGVRYRVRTDEEGMFSVRAHDLAAPLTAGRHRVRARLIEDRGHPAPPATGWLNVLPDRPSMAVLSDFDDTVAESHVTDKSKALLYAFTRNAAQVPVVPGAPEAFRAARGAGAVGFFFVSGSPQNLLPRIVDFLRLHDFPAAAVVTRDIGNGPLFSSEAFKLEQISAILTLFPRTRFVLLGDSGERDPEVYRAITQRFPGRIAAIVIRRVPGSDVTAARLVGMTAVDDYSSNARILANMISPR